MMKFLELVYAGSGLIELGGIVFNVIEKFDDISRNVILDGY